MRLKQVLLRGLDRFLEANAGFIRLFLDNPAGRKFFLDKYLRNRPSLFFSYYRSKPPAGNSKNILILKTDAIGDYLLFRNFLKDISRQYKPGGYRIFLAGNLLWKDLALELDGSLLDGSFWLDRRGLNVKPGEARQIEFLQQINRRTYARLLYPNFSREWEAGDWLAAHIPAPEKWAYDGNLINETETQHRQGNGFYNFLIHPRPGVQFDFFRNCDIVSAFLGREAQSLKPAIRGIVPEPPVQGPYAVIFPGASHDSKRWPAEGFSGLAAFLEKEFKGKVVLAGSAAEADLCREIALAAPVSGLNLAGKTTVSGLLKLIAGADVLISNDTAALHMGIQCGIPSLALWKGNHYGRFLPYPEEDFPNVRICMPPSLETLGREKLEAEYGENYGADISGIPLEKVTTELAQMLGMEPTSTPR